MVKKVVPVLSSSVNRIPSRTICCACKLSRIVNIVHVICISIGSLAQLSIFFRDKFEIVIVWMVAKISSTRRIRSIPRKVYDFSTSVIVGCQDKISCFFKFDKSKSFSLKWIAIRMDAVNWVRIVSV
ncbi:hypothetical protein D3C86_913550 [compost metagenome]